MTIIIKYYPKTDKLIMSKKTFAMKKLFFLILVSFVFIPGSVFAQKQPKIHGRIQYDVEALKRTKDTAWALGNEFRRVHLSVGGRLTDNLRYKVEVNFAHGKIGFRDVYIKYLSRWGNFGIGSLAEPTGLAMATSSKYIPLAERPMLSALQNFRWGAGLHYANYSLLSRHLGIQAALTGNGKNGEGFLDKHLERGLNFSARMFGYIPFVIAGNRYGVHLGVNTASRPAADLHFRPENHLGDKYAYVFPGAKRRMVWGGETALILKSVSLRGEYKTQRLPAAGNVDYRVNGMYITAGFLLTGEKYRMKYGGFARIVPEYPVSDEGWGAWEVVTRFSQMTVNNVVLAANPQMPENITTYTFGLNWYPLARLRLMYNFTLTRDGLAQGPLHAHIFRIQVDF